MIKGLHVNSDLKLGIKTELENLWTQILIFMKGGQTAFNYHKSHTIITVTSNLTTYNPMNTHTSAGGDV